MQKGILAILGCVAALALILWHNDYSVSKEFVVKNSDVIAIADITSVACKKLGEKRYLTQLQVAPVTMLKGTMPASVTLDMGVG